MAPMSAVTGVASDVEGLRTDIADLGEQLRVAESEREGLLAVRIELSALADRLDEFDARITSVSTELANQISELGNELSSLDRATDDRSSLDELRRAQTALASEQARYQIAFRQDLAELADRLRPR